MFFLLGLSHLPPPCQVSAHLLSSLRLLVRCHLSREVSATTPYPTTMATSFPSLPARLCFSSELIASSCCTSICRFCSFWKIGGWRAGLPFLMALAPAPAGAGTPYWLWWWAHCPSQAQVTPVLIQTNRQKTKASPSSPIQLLSHLPPFTTFWKGPSTLAVWTFSTMVHPSTLANWLVTSWPH